MLHATQGNLLEADAEALVNTVNCMGYMGRGIALQFKQAFPANFTAYHTACKAAQVRPGQMLIHEISTLVNPRYIINFPTKRHWRGDSRIEDIESGLQALTDDIQHLGIQSVAVPPLGCGLGRLRWQDVRPLIERAFDRLPEVRVLLYSPNAEPDVTTRPVRTDRPEMTAARALFVKLMGQYKLLAYRLTLLEVQKLAYFLQEAGEPLHLRYEPGLYGPYAPNLNKVLERIEGHFTRGYAGERAPDVEIDLVPGALDEADELLTRMPQARARLDRVAELIAGFETPYGLELLSSVHWVASKIADPARREDEAIDKVHAWNDRKRRVLKPQHIRTAWQHLQHTGWLSA